MRRLTFHERASLLKAVAQALTARKEELYALSVLTGATRADSWIDIDGGIGTLFVYASKGKRELPNETFLIDGAVEGLSKTGSFLGQHIYVPREGVAVQINAYNFPVWGMLEKLGPSILAGSRSSRNPRAPPPGSRRRPRGSSSRAACCRRARSSSSRARPAISSTTSRARIT